ncbi:hypothetical protein R1sor_019449 [Riccia sorocarpa]|uniref:pectinesterase n=1 Tax=Riccia sorocarpa TaxID=122646 RepID=A0ABD3IGU0_9MARC
MSSSGGERREIIVAQNGNGDYKTVQEAIDSVPLRNTQRVIIRIGWGVYTQPIYIPKTKNLITLSGTNPERTTLSWNNTATSCRHHQGTEVIGTGTFACATVIVEGEDFIAENLTFENSAPQGSGQAVAIRVTADRCAFYNCRFLGWQDTAYLHYGRQYFRDCYIEGSVDFLFGNATVLLEHCHIHCKSKGFITAQQRKNADESTGYVFLRCVITGTGDTKPYMHLGRPWAPYARVVFAYSYIDCCIVPAGWNNWDNAENEKTACYYEYRCFGPGSDMKKRVPWARTLRPEEADHYMSTSFIDSQRTWINMQKFAPPSIPVPLSA